MVIALTEPLSEVYTMPSFRFACYGLLAAWPAVTLCPAAVHADDWDQYRIPCTDENRAVIDEAMAEAEALALVALEALPPVNSETGAVFVRWFGGAEGESDPQVEAIYDEVQNFLFLQTVWCPNQNMSQPDHTLAWVPRDGGFEIFVEPSFFALPTADWDSQGGTILHEASHLATVASVVDSDVTGDRRPDYGLDDAEQLARTRPDLARRTANNLQYFAEDVAFAPD